jgi:choice-of-anchor B domain-containing protein
VAPGLPARLASTAGFAAALAAVLVPSFAARADDDDPKFANRKPALIRSAWRNPDPWKLANHGPIHLDTDSTFPSRGMALLSTLPVNTFPGYSAGYSAINGADCWGYTSPSGREYILMGLSWGTAIVEVTNPAEPHVLTTIPGFTTQGASSLWRDVTVVGEYCYSVSDSTGVGIQVIDLHDVDAGQVTLVRNYSQGGHTTSHTILSNPESGYLYVCGGNAAGGGMIPAATAPDPTLPTFAGLGWTTQYVHEAQILDYTTGPYAGREIAFLFAAGPYYGYSRGLAIADVTDKSNVGTMSLISYPGIRFCHQGWVSNDRKYLYVDDELDSPDSGNVPRDLTRVFDISDLSTPRLVSLFTTGLPSVDHNQYVNGRYLYQSNYTTGLHVFDMADPLRPVEVAYIDTRPEDDGPGYDGAWGNYPYLASGTLAISDIQRGLFVARLALLEMSTPAAPPALLAPGQPTPVSVTVGERNAFVRDVALMVSVNGGPEAEIPMTLSGAEYVGSIPPAACGDRVAYYFRATDTSDSVYTWPAAGASSAYIAYAQSSSTLAFADTFETDTGWTVTNTGAVTGAWTRATPLYNGGPGAVVGDADGSGRCFVTGNVLNQDVDGGTTRLVSPPIDLSATPGARISVSRWLFSCVGTADSLVTEVSGDGSTWVPVDSVGMATGGWKTLEFRVADYIAPTAAVRVRFSVGDTDASTTEAGIDDFRVIVPACSGGAPCYANCDGSSSAPVLNVLDFNCFLNRFAAGESYANCDGSTVAPIFNVLDFNCFLNRFSAGCP